MEAQGPSLGPPLYADTEPKFLSGYKKMSWQIFQFGQDLRAAWLPPFYSDNFPAYFAGIFYNFKSCPNLPGKCSCSNLARLGHQNYTSTFNAVWKGFRYIQHGKVHVSRVQKGFVSRYLLTSFNSIKKKILWKCFISKRIFEKMHTL